MSSSGRWRVLFMQITEIYKSLQGESTYAGLPCVFVRLTGCNLRCTWCDSEYTFQGGRKMTVEEVRKEVSRVPAGVIKIVDVKCPDSGEGDTFHLENLRTLTVRDEVKFVLSSRADYDFAREFTQRHSLGARVNAVLFSPAFRKDASGARDASHCILDPQELAEWIIADNVPARLGLQLHKFIWDPAVKGV